MLTIRYNFTGTGGNVVLADIPTSIFSPPQEYMFVIAGWLIPGGDGNVHVQVNKGAGGFTALATPKDILYRGQLTIMI